MARRNIIMELDMIVGRQYYIESNNSISSSNTLFTLQVVRSVVYTSHIIYLKLILLKKDIQKINRTLIPLPAIGV